MGFMLAEMQHLQRAYPRGRVVTRHAADRAPGLVLGTVLDPEVPALSVRDLGIVRDVIDHGDELEVVLTPTYSGCPATEVIEQTCWPPSNAKAWAPRAPRCARARLDHRLDQRRRPRKLREYGIAPPAHLTPEAAEHAHPLKLFFGRAGRRAHRLPALRQRAHRALSPSAPRPARRCTAAWPAASPSNTSSRSE
jgi:ring-1,2-phenylacetyl-CoA epoxidase subunit PaaD